MKRLLVACVALLVLYPTAVARAAPSPISAKPKRVAISCTFTLPDSFCAEGQVVVTNNSASQLVVTPIFEAGQTNFAFSGATCDKPTGTGSYVLFASESCMVGVAFLPASPGRYSGTLTVAWSYIDSAGSGQSTVKLSGVAA